MNEDKSIPEMRPFVMSLLVVASGDNRTVPEAVNIVHNAAFRYCLEVLGDFPALARTAIHGDCTFGGWLRKEVGARGFFVFCGQLLDAIDARIRGRHPSLSRTPADQPSTYDHAAFLAVGQTLCRTAGVRGARFPAIEDGFRRIADSKPRDLQKTFVKNYLGNVLQDYFDASRVRSEFPSLPGDTEATLRTEEAAALAEMVFAAISGDGGPVQSTVIQTELQAAIARVWLAEKALDD